MTIAYAPTADPVLDDAAIQTLRASLRGEVLRPDDRGYDDARRVWNAMVDQRPALIARCAGAADVVAAVGFAREQGLLVSVKGGGHGVAGKAVCDGGLMIDLSPMQAIAVDPVRRIARAEGGVTWGDFDRATQAVGLATTGGVIPSTGIAGLTLGGGIGFLMRRFGLSLRQPALRRRRHRRWAPADGQRRGAPRPLLGSARRRRQLRRRHRLHLPAPRRSARRCSAA